MSSSKKASASRTQPYVAPSTRPNPTPRDVMYIAGTGKRPDMSIEDAERLKSELEERERSQSLRERPLYVHLKDVQLSANPTSEHMLQYFRVPLPGVTDPYFKIDIISNGKIGFQLAGDDVRNDSAPVHPYVAQTVDNAMMCLDDEIRGGIIWTQRVYFAQELTKMTPTDKRIRPGYTLGHLVTLLLHKQYRHWFSQVITLMSESDTQPRPPTQLPALSSTNLRSLPIPYPDSSALKPVPRLRPKSELRVRK
ncbi:hypothetical protein ONZ51_g2176 [Trametes cubensis]|uniref:Uncharacterized protein n=1 Tax=Trametes cubensis TaxID=1111947 RepID=A0AAD7U0T1_9APHY|nr:hypothetical protein ONZ51_g2176 [Trametes cubensis]